MKLFGDDAINILLKDVTDKETGEIKNLEEPIQVQIMKDQPAYEYPLTLERVRSFKVTNLIFRNFHIAPTKRSLRRDNLHVRTAVSRVLPPAAGNTTPRTWVTPGEATKYPIVKASVASVHSL